MLLPTFDMAAILNPNDFDIGRVGVLFGVCHDTAGPYDDNTITDPNLALARSNASAHYLSNNAAPVSIHYLVGAEAAGAPIYKIIPETNTAYHAGGNPPQFPSTITDPDTGAVFHNYAVNQRSLGIERFGQPHDTVGPKQTAALQKLVLDIITRNPALKDPRRWFAHASLEGDRKDGNTWLAIARAAVSAPPAPVQVAAYDPNPKKFSIGPGILDAMRKRNATAATNEQYFIPSPGQAPGLFPRSYAWDTDGYIYLAFQKSDPHAPWDIIVCRNI